ncbi:hypothetical protein AUP68_06407 [Ilyonectria robusta]
MARSRAAHKVAPVILRFLEFCCAVIVLGLLSRFVYLTGIAEVNCDGRIIYTLVVAGIGIVCSILLCPPFVALFLSLPFDFVLFVMWLVAYCLLQSLHTVCTLKAVPTLIAFGNHQLQTPLPLGHRIEVAAFVESCPCVFACSSNSPSCHTPILIRDIDRPQCSPTGLILPKPWSELVSAAAKQKERRMPKALRAKVDCWKVSAAIRVAVELESYAHGLERCNHEEKDK